MLEILVLKATKHVQKGLTTSNLAPKWEGHYILREAYDSGYYLISRPNSEDQLALINEKLLKLYYH